MKTIESFIKAIKDLENLPNIDDLVDDEEGIPTISSSSATFINNVDDDVLDTLVELEHSATYHFFDETGRIKQDCVRKLKNNGLDIVKLNENFAPFSHGIKSEKFHVLVSL